MESIPVSSPNSPMPPKYRHTVCPSSLDSTYIVTYYVKWVKTSGTDSSYGSGTSFLRDRGVVSGLKIRDRDPRTESKK